MTDFRVLCADLLAWAEKTSAHYYQQPDVLIRARAALAQLEPEAVGPTDEEIMGLMSQQMHEDLAAAVRAMAAQEGIDSTPAKGVMRIMLNRHVVDLARAVLARFGHQPAPPAAGEVGELVAWLRMQGEAQKPGPNSLLSDQTKKERHAIGVKLTRAADLLEQRHPAPVPVSERLPGAGDCDAEGRCWLLGKVERDWRLINPGESGLPQLKYCFSHWLPSTALPLPQGEVGA